MPKAIYSVRTTWGIREDNLFLLDVDHARLDFPSLERRVIYLARDGQIFAVGANLGSNITKRGIEHIPTPLGPLETACGEFS